MKKPTDPLMNKNDIETNSDNKIDQDFKGFPHGTASENIINPKTNIEKKVAAVNITDGEKVNKNAGEKDESESDGSGGAFEGTENMQDDE
jgi:ABC-type polar amino acid transport system ATPase subunit